MSASLCPILNQHHSLSLSLSLAREIKWSIPISQCLRHKYFTVSAQLTLFQQIYWASILCYSINPMPYISLLYFPFQLVRDFHILGGPPSLHITTPNSIACSTLYNYTLSSFLPPFSLLNFNSNIYILPLHHFNSHFFYPFSLIII